MDKLDLTKENLQRLIEISTAYNEFLPDYLTWEKVSKEDPIDTLMSIFFYCNFELLEISEFKDYAMEIVFNKGLEEMPLLINPNEDYSERIDSPGNLSYYPWLPIVARWRLDIGC